MSGFSFPTPHRARRLSLTPMIDVVFLLLVFFMLAARFGQDTAIVLKPPVATTDTVWFGAPRLVTLTPQTPLLNGVPVAPSSIADTIRPLMENSDDPILLRAERNVPLQDLIDLLDLLSGAGLSGAGLLE